MELVDQFKQSLNALIPVIDERVEQAKKTGKPLVVVFGENHTMPAHRLFQIEIMRHMFDHYCDSMKLSMELEAASPEVERNIAYESARSWKNFKFSPYSGGYLRCFLSENKAETIAADLCTDDTDGDTLTFLLTDEAKSRLYTGVNNDYSSLQDILSLGDKVETGVFEPECDYLRNTYTVGVFSKEYEQAEERPSIMVHFAGNDHIDTEDPNSIPSLLSRHHSGETGFYSNALFVSLEFDLEDDGSPSHTVFNANLHDIEFDYRNDEQATLVEEVEYTYDLIEQLEDLGVTTEEFYDDLHDKLHALEYA